MTVAYLVPYLPVTPTSAQCTLVSELLPIHKIRTTYS